MGVAARRESARYTWPEALESVAAVYAEAVADAASRRRLNPLARRSVRTA